MTSIGFIEEETLSIEKEDGTELTLYEEGHILRDSLQQEPILRVKCTIIGIPDATRAAFWKTTTAGAGNAKKVKVASLVTSDKYAIKFAAEQVPGSETFEAPYCTVNMGPLYSSTGGWKADVQITLVKNGEWPLFSFGVVAISE
jgi:hypothetical protein